MKLAHEFRDFLFKQNALALAVGVVLGAAVSKVVSGLVDDVIMPIIGVVLPGGGWRMAQLPLDEQNAIKYGDLLGRLVDFLIVAAVIFFVTKALLKQPKSAPTKPCPFCLDPLPLAATRCRSCTSQLPADTGAPR